MADSHRSRQASLRTSTMLNNHARAQAVSLSPLFNQKSAKNQISSNENRRVTIAGVQTHDADSPARAARIKKITTPSRKRRNNNTPSLVEKFNNALDVQHDEIADWAEESLNHCQKRLNEELENVVEEFGALMQVMAGVEDHVDEPFGNERLVTSRQDENGVRQEVGFPIADRMQALHDIIEREENQLDGGWQQWSVVQAEMICLAIEVLGSDNVHLENSILLDSLVKQIEMAGNQHEKDNMRYVEVEQAIFGLETELTRMCNDRSKMMKAQQKTLRAERKKMLDNIKKAMADFEKIR